MATRHVIVDGSNIATEGRNMPSLEQLDQAVREFMAENPGDEVMVVVDASFGHRIDPAEVSAFEAAEAAGEVVSPPAGAIGRGDAFLLRIAEKIGATVLSNDSFQEFHGEHVWLFEKGRLVGGKPVSGVGWIFMDRTPVRGAKSREVTKEAKRRKRSETEEAGAKAGGERPARARTKVVDRAIARATQEVVEPKDGPKSRRRRSTSPPAEPVNEPLAFITFIAAHPLGSEVVGEVVEYSSHGAFVDADGARCYIPLSAMGDPPPRKAREVVTKGAPAPFVVQAFDPQRRGIELALPGFAHLAGSPTAETVEAEIRGDAKAPTGVRPAARGRRRPAAAPEDGGVAEVGVVEAAPVAGPAGPAGPEPAPGGAPTAPDAETAEPEKVPVAKAGRRRSPARMAAAQKPAGGMAADEQAPAPGPAAPAKKETGKRAPAAKKAPATTAAPQARKIAPADEPAKKATAKKTAAKKATGTEKAASAKKTAAKKATGAEKAASAKKAPAAKKAAPGKKAAVAKELADPSGVSTNGPVRPPRAAKKTPAAMEAAPGGTNPTAPRKTARKAAAAPASADNG